MFDLGQPLVLCLWGTLFVYLICMGTFNFLLEIHVLTLSHKFRWFTHVQLSCLGVLDVRLRVGSEVEEQVFSGEVHPLFRGQGPKVCTLVCVFYTCILGLFQCSIFRVLPLDAVM